MTKKIERAIARVMAEAGCDETRALWALKESRGGQFWDKDDFGNIAEAITIAMSKSLDTDR